jgi:endoglucanase
MTRFKSLLPAGLILSLYGCSVSSVDAVARPEIKVSQAYLVKPDILAIRIDVGKAIYGKQVPYQTKSGDRKEEPRPPGDDWLTRGGKAIGTLVGRQRNVIHMLDEFIPSPFDPQWADRSTSYRITSREDSTYSSQLNPTSVSRKSKPTDMARVGQWKFEFPMSHVMYLKLPSPLREGKTYQINFPESQVQPLSFKYEPNVTRSEAVHVSHVGFSPNDPAKVAFLSTWMGSGGKVEYSPGQTFSVIDEKTNQKVFTGKTQLSKSSEEKEDPRKRNYTLTNVYLMDFSRVQTPGQYRVCVDSVGCSVSFQINSDVWKSAFTLSARGLYHQRSGIALTEPYTDWKRPRAFHPDDGVEVYASTAKYMDLTPDNDFSKALPRRKTNQKLPNAWGGYFDAGDWDRNINHVDVARSLLELEELFPNYFSRVNLNIPESKDALPDVINEGLWTIDFFKRLQTPEGGIRGGIDSQGHPKFGEASWQESYTVMAFAPETWSSYLYAGVAARAAHSLRSRDAKRAQSYQDSALKAFDYAEREISNGAPMTKQVRDARNLAAVEFLRLTRDPKWHQVFLQATVFKDPKQEVIVWDQHDQREAAFLYARLPKNLVDSTIQRNAVNAIVRDADTAVSVSDQTAFKWSKELPFNPIGWGSGLGAPKGVAIVRAHYLTQDSEYLRSAVLSTQFALGANPDNMTYTTGLGQRSPRNPLIVDQRMMGTTPPPGITVYGPYDPLFYGDTWTINLFKDVIFPAPIEWPAVESYFDIYLFPLATEFTIMQTVSPTAYLWGYLAAKNAPTAKSTN